MNDSAPVGLLVGALGWDDAAWVRDYYPEDLPEDWRPTYYANELRAVLLPATRWSGRPAAVATTWTSDTDPQFRFFLLWPEQGAGPEAAFAASLGARLAGLLLPAGVPVPKGELPWLPHVSDCDGPGGWGRLQDPGRPSVLIAGDPGSAARAQRELLETARRRLAPEGLRALFLEGAPAIHVQGLRLLAELMGLA